MNRSKQFSRNLIQSILALVCMYWWPVTTGYSRAIEWSGISWDVKEGFTGPGPNHFSASTNNVWVDTSGFLHLKLTENAGTWSAAEIISRKSMGFGYGEYRFQVESRVDNFDTNIVAGLFTFLDNNNEIDIEFTRAFPHLGPSENAQFTTQPNVQSNRFPFSLNQSSQTQTTHRFEWEADRIFYESYFSHSDPPPASNDVIASFLYTGSDIPVPSTERVHLNLWLFQGQPPSDTQNLELVVQDFTYVITTNLPLVESTVSVTAEVLEGGESFLAVDATDLNFGTVNRAPTNHRFQSNVLTCRFFAATRPWSIRVGTENIASIDGLVPTLNGVQQLGQGFIPLKVNQPNFGVGSPDDDANWEGSNPVWIRVDDFSFAPADLASSASMDTPDIELRFAFDVDEVEGSPVTSNYSGIVKFELAVE